MMEIFLFSVFCFLVDGSLMRYKIALLPLFALLAACSSKPQGASGSSPQEGFLRPPGAGQGMLSADFLGQPQTEAFITMMVKKHGFDRRQLESWLGQARRLDYVLRLMDRQAPNVAPAVGPNGAWLRYRKNFITPGNVQNGVAFWDQYQTELQQAQQKYGVPPEIIVGIIGVETRWGRVMGKTRILDALATLAFDYPRRSAYFSSELETFLLMARNEKESPLGLRGSFAGAMGYGQFMPSAYQKYAVDFNGDGHINLWDPVDAIGSVAHYFQQHGWQAGQAVAVTANGSAPGLKDGFTTRYSVSQLAAYGLQPQMALSGSTEVSLLRLDMGQYYQYWFGLPNFYVITRYNHSTHYAMAVWQLGEAVRNARQGRIF